jgi:hypothetical protein
MSSGAGTCVHITASDVTLSGVGILIQGPGAKTATIGVDIDLFANNVTLQSVEAMNFGEGIHIDGPNATVRESATSSNNRGTVVNGVHALLIDQSSQRDGAAGIQVNASAKNFGMMSGTANAATGAGIELNGVSGAFLSSTVTDDDGTFGIWLKNASNNLISAFESEDNGIAGVYLGCNAAGPNGKSSCALGSNSNTLTGDALPFPGTYSVVSDTGNILQLQQSYGIAVGRGNLRNHILNIMGTGNVVDDALDENPNCGNNRWTLNNFTKSSPAKNTSFTCIN